jgi:hypothetical protein
MCILMSSEAAGKHTGPVWQLKWIEKERGSSDEHVEILVTVSTDGRVTQWAIRKGFESYGTWFLALCYHHFCG